MTYHRDDAKDELFVLSHEVRPFLDASLGLATPPRTREAVRAFEHLVDFEEYLRMQDPTLHSECSQSITIAKRLLARHLKARGYKAPLEELPL